MPAVGDPILAADAVSVVLGSSVALAASSTTLQNVTGLSAAVVSGRTYRVQVVIFASNAAGTTEDLKIGFTFPTGTLRAGVIGGTTAGVAGSTTTDMQLAFTTFTSGTTTVAVGLSTNITTTIITGVYTCTASGTFQVQAAQSTSGVNVCTIAASSFLALNAV